MLGLKVTDRTTASTNTTKGVTAVVSLHVIYYPLDNIRPTEFQKCIERDKRALGSPNDSATPKFSSHKACRNIVGANLRPPASK